MQPRTPALPRVVQFGVFELDVRAGELRKSGIKLKLQKQPLQVLAALLERPGDIVTREELRHRIWPSDTFVDFDQGLNKAVNKVREILSDSATAPRFMGILSKARRNLRQKGREMELHRRSRSRVACHASLILRESYLIRLDVLTCGRRRVVFGLLICPPFLYQS